MATDQVSQQNRTYIASGGIDDDSGTVQRFGDGSSIQTLEDGSTLVTDSDGNISSTPAPPEYSNAGTTQAGKSGTRSAKNKRPKPGKRLQNPLGNFSSYTYQISLYMITPEAYNTFVQSGRKNISAFQGVDNTSKGAFLIAQSGGINNSTTKRAPEFDLDFYIDDLKIKAVITGKETLTATNIEEINFNIYEPYGFSFLTRLRRALDALNQSPPSNANAANGVDEEGRNVGIEVRAEDGTLSQSRRNPETGELYNPAVESTTGTPNSSAGGKTSPLSAQSQNPSRQFFILGIRFQGYDRNGKLISTKDQSGYNADPTGNANGVYERFFDIKIQELKFKIDGRMVVYQCTAVVPKVSEAMGTKRGIIDNGVTIVGGTVNDAFLGETEGNIGMFTKLNNDQKKLKTQGSINIPNEFTVTYLGNTEITVGGASIVSPADIDKLKWKMTNAKTTTEVNVKTEEKSTVDNTKRQITIRRGVPILQAIQQIISQSSFLEAALNKVYTTVEEPDTQGEDDETVNSDENTISWYNVSPEITILGWDDLTGDYAYRINYVIQPYSTPIVNSPYVKRTPKYYGPHKRYDYWFTGKNSEVLKYEQTFDNAYFTVAIDPGNSKQASGGEQQVPTIANKQQNQPKQGALNLGREAQNSYMTSLFDPGAYAEAKISILGDPDFLMTTSASSVQAVYDQFYGPDGYTINPNGGQTFIEINFKEPQDYNNKDGLLSINESILFYPYPDEVRKDIDSRGGGISYLVKTVTSSFKGGKFEQDLELVINTFASLTNTPTNEGARPQATTSVAATPTADPANISAAVAARTGVNLNSTAGAGRGGRGGPTAAELAAYQVSQGKGFQQSPPITNATGNVTGGGAAFGNPNLARQANKARNNQAQQGTKTVPTKTGQVQDDDGGTGTYVAA
jgi:hypothetical protein